MVWVLLLGHIIQLPKKKEKLEDDGKEKREEVEKTLEEHQANIQEHIKQAQSSYDFHLLTNLHYSSVKVADSAYKLLGDARDSIRGINTMLMNAKKHKLELEAQLQIA